jgi:hypothetical protein
VSPVHTAPANLSSADASLRAAYVQEVLELLYPADPGGSTVDAAAAGAAGATGATGSAADTGGTEYLLVPDSRRPRLLVPARDRRVAAAAVSRYAEPQTRLARFKRDAVVAALRTGASTALLRDRIRVTGGSDTIETYLRGVFDMDLRLSVHIGPARANRKPVIQLLSPLGETVGFAKLGVNALTRQLVRAEASALAALGRCALSEVSVPAILHTGQWRGHEVLVQRALPVWRAKVPVDRERLGRAMREVAMACGASFARLAGSGYWLSLGERLTAVAGHPEGHQLGRAARRIATAAGTVGLTFGSWHGDWSPWNMRAVADSVLVWDWERFTIRVPVGFDALHFDLQQRISTQSEPTAAVRQMLQAAPELLAPFDVVAPAQVRLTSLLYLVDLATRYLTDRQAEAGARLGVLGRWLLPVLVSTVEDL